MRKERILQMPGPVRVLVVDDSAVMRKIITEMLERDPSVKVVGAARNGQEAVHLVKELKPDVVTLDIEMPVMDGLTALQHIMNESPVPVVMLSAVGKRQSELTLKSLERGAVDFIPKTGASLSLDLEMERDLIVQKVKAASQADIKPLPISTERPIVSSEVRSTCGDWVVMIGASTGGPKALPEVLSRLPSDLPAGVLIVQHMPEGFTRSFAERLNWVSAIEVREAEEGDPVEMGVALLAPGNRHMVLRDGRIHLNDDPKVHYVRPAVDPMMRTVAPAYGPRCVGVILTGMGFDGVEGMREVKRQGGKTIVQDERSCVVYGMPKAIVDAGAADKVAPVDQIARHIVMAMADVGV
ncbi:MAG: chemotaxis response regulator protein-glutamate methylesterase [Methanomassiliicoccales archaeon]|nr:chemotaxis response regulator protein-glutamate methylesterase [Methanomassiliicoccales archaeon]